MFCSSLTNDSNGKKKDILSSFLEENNEIESLKTRIALAYLFKGWIMLSTG